MDRCFLDVVAISEFLGKKEAGREKKEGYALPGEAGDKGKRVSEAHMDDNNEQSAV